MMSDYCNTWLAITRCVASQRKSAKALWLFLLCTNSHRHRRRILRRERCLLRLRSFGCNESHNHTVNWATGDDQLKWGSNVISHWVISLRTGLRYVKPQTGSVWRFSWTVSAMFCYSRQWSSRRCVVIASIRQVLIIRILIIAISLIVSNIENELRF